MLTNIREVNTCPSVKTLASIDAIPAPAVAHFLIQSERVSIPLISIPLITLTPNATNPRGVSSIAEKVHDTEVKNSLHCFDHNFCRQTHTE